MTMSVAHDHRRGGQPAARPAAALGRRRHLCAADHRRQPAADRSRHACGRSRSGNGSSTITRCPKPTSIPSPCAASPGFRRNGWRRCSTPRPCVAGWTGPVVLAAAAIAATFALLRDILIRHLSESTTLVFVAAALALTAPHLLARPHVLALPVMVAWVGGLDRGRRSARGAVVLAAAADGAVGQSAWRLCLRPVADRADRARCRGRRRRAMRRSRWRCAGRLFGALALAASCCTPYGWNSLLASQKILASAARCR